MSSSSHRLILASKFAASTALAPGKILANEFETTDEIAGTNPPTLAKD